MSSRNYEPVRDNGGSTAILIWLSGIKTKQHISIIIIFFFFRGLSAGSPQVNCIIIISFLSLYVTFFSSDLTESLVSTTIKVIIFVVAVRVASHHLVLGAGGGQEATCSTTLSAGVTHEPQHLNVA